MFVLSGVGAVTALGIGCDALWHAMSEGRDGFGTISRFPIEDFSIRTGAMVPGYDHVAGSTWRELCLEFTLAAAREARDRANLEGADIAPHRIAMVLGTSTAGDYTNMHEIAEQVGDTLGFKGPRMTVSTACSSSTTAVGIARDLVRMGAADVVFAGGTDVLVPILFAGFYALGVMCPSKCAPFSTPEGMSLGEGAGFVVVERAETARARDAHVIANLRGFGLSCDGFDDTSPEPNGKGVARSIASALRDAAMPAEVVDYVNAHGTGTGKNDPSEWRGIGRAFGQHADALELSSSKSFLGHAQGAAGILELIATLLAMEHNSVPPTMHFRGARPRCPADPVGQETPRRAQVEVALSTNSAFGGSNAAVIVSRQASSTEPAPRTRVVPIAGVGVIGSASTDALLDAVRAGKRLAGPAAFSLSDFVPTVDPRELDRTSQLLTSSTALALANADLRLRGSLKEETGLFFASHRLSPSTVADFLDSIEERGLPRLSTSAFGRMVLNAPAGRCARVLNMRGPTTTLAAASGGALATFAYAAEYWSRRDDVRYLAVGAADELSSSESPGECAEGSATVLYGGAESGVVVAGWCIAPPGAGESACTDALAQAGLEPGEVELVFGEQIPLHINPAAARFNPRETVGPSAVYPEALAMVAAVSFIRAGEASSALILSPTHNSSCTALVLRTQR